MLDFARERGAERVALHVVEGNESANGLYLRHGFVDMGPVPGTAVGGRLEHRMERVLAAPASLPRDAGRG